MQLNFGPQKEPEYSGAKKVLATAISTVRIGYQYGFIPYVIYLGMLLFSYFF